ncbi:MAG: hypothetical protein AAGG50_00155 [Bacteroidota bacterium]
MTTLTSPPNASTRTRPVSTSSNYEASASKPSAPVDWHAPVPRPGLAGGWDRFIGPGATPAEQALAVVPALIAAIVLPVYAAAQGLDWTTAQAVVAGLLAFDIVGGVVTNATSSAKRWYHRAGQGARQHLSFVALHVAQIGLVGWLFRDLDFAYIGVVYGALLAAAVLVLRVPRRLQRSVALLLTVAALPFGLYALAPTPGLEWFVPALFLKLLVSHLTAEEPYA